MAGEKKALRAKIEGRVQGVNFRMATAQAADKLGVCGWVRNKADGSVEAFFEGDADRLDAMIKWCQEGPSMARVSNVSVFEEDFTGTFIDFSVRYT